MDSNKKVRNSSLELLRILCMILIVFHHYSGHGGFDYSNFGLTFNEIYIKIMVLGGKLACDIFILITGYFLINKKYNYNKIIKLVEKMTLYGIIIFLIFYKFNIVNFSLNNLIKSIIPFTADCWFVINYILLYLISPYLNSMLKKLDRKSYLKMITIIITIWSTIPTIVSVLNIHPKLSLEVFGYSNIDTFLVMYIIGAYIRLHTVESNSKNIKNLIISISSSLVIIMFSVLITILGKHLGNKDVANSYSCLSSINSIFAVIAAIYIFKFFKNITFESKIVNFISSTTLGIYLIHDNFLVRGYIWSNVSPNTKYMFSRFLVGHSILKCLVIFISCAIIDKVFSFILSKTLDKVIDKVNITQKIKEVIRRFRKDKILYLNPKTESTVVE